MTSLPNSSAASKPGKKKITLNTPPKRATESRGEVPRVAEVAKRARKSKGGALLSDVSHRDRAWDEMKAQADEVARLYAEAKELKISESMCECARWLLYSLIPNRDTGEFHLRLKRARFCREKFCPVCIKRLSIMRRARFVKFIDDPKFSSGKGKWIHVTFTVENVPLEQLRVTIQKMTKAFGEITRLKGWPALGWIRSTEVTRAKNDFAHPHLHVLMFVPHSYFVRGNYINKRGWIEIWRNALRADYDPSVWIRLYKIKKVDKDGKVIMLGAAEIIKYPVKGCDLLGTKKKPGLIRKGKRNNAEWLAELTRQMKGLHLISAGGYLKSVFKDEKEEDDEDLIRSGVTTREEMNELEEAWFLWRRLEKRYRHQPRYVPDK